MGKLFTQKYIGSYRSPNDNHSFPHDARPHHAGFFQCLDQEEEYKTPGYNPKSKVMMCFRRDQGGDGLWREVAVLLRPVGAIASALSGRNFHHCLA